MWFRSRPHSSISIVFLHVYTLCLRDVAIGAAERKVASDNPDSLRRFPGKADVVRIWNQHAFFRGTGMKVAAESNQCPNCFAADVCAFRDCTLLDR